MRRIASHPLWIGSIEQACKADLLEDQGIQAVVALSMTESLKLIPRELICCRFPLVDGTDNSAWIIESAIQTTALLLRAEIGTLVACGAGMSRSPAIAAAALCVASGRPITECLQEVVAAGPVDISPGLWNDVLAVLKKMPG